MQLMFRSMQSDLLQIKDETYFIKYEKTTPTYNARYSHVGVIFSSFSQLFVNSYRSEHFRQNKI